MDADGDGAITMEELKGVLNDSAIPYPYPYPYPYP